jgi:hypothetical protein
MYSRLHNNGLKTGWITWVSKGVQMGFKRVSKRDQNTRFFSADFLTSRRLVNGVYFLLHFVGLECLSVISPTRVRDTTVSKQRGGN